MSKEFKVGLFALIAFVLLYVGFRFLKGIDAFTSTHTYYVYYDEVPGLQVSSPVKITGLNVGRVADIEIDYDKANQILVTLEVDEEVVLNNKTTATITSAGLLGDKSVNLDLNDGTTALEDEATLIPGKSSDMIAELTAKADPLINNADATMDSVQAAIAAINRLEGDIQQMVVAFTSTARNFSELSYSLKSGTGQIGGVVSNVNQLTRELNDTQKGLRPLLERTNVILGNTEVLTDSLNNVNIGALAASLEANMNELNRTLRNVNDPDGNLGLLLHDQALYTNMNQTMTSLDSLLIDLRENPKRYVHFSVFGRKNK